ncbi:transaldolase family protein [Zongyangia hominis]|uniref:Transaldolase n=1 Tax=Zongyangia hominis TaxID=2763677 RepID=A0A926EF97_9FIRM|nr:transaldolase family protein [Zongyangia hominis]MBC8571399.1 transaldolase [Zongyangia hominis]
MILSSMKCTFGALVESGKLSVALDTDAGLFERIKNLELDFDDYERLSGVSSTVGVTEEFQKVLRTFPVPQGEIPAGFRPELLLGGDGSVRVDLKRDISYEKNGKKRPTSVLYSANSANPFEVSAMKDMIASLTTNPQIIYDHFLHNPKANVGGQFRDRFEVLEELARIVGPGVDISVEVNDPFAPESELMEEIARCEEILTPYRLVVKVPHTGALNKENVGDFLAGTLDVPYDGGSVEDNFYGHNFAYKLSEQGYRVNFTLMFDPHQTALALLAKPYFINAFVETRHLDTLKMRDLLQKLDLTGDEGYAQSLRQFMIDTDTLPRSSLGAPVKDAVEKARALVSYRQADTHEGSDGLDSVRHSLRLLRQSNLPDTRLIICNTNYPQIYWDIDKMLTEPEFADMAGRVVITATPTYFGQFTCAPGIFSYQRKFLTASN